jgi:signal transduction histidine kinase
MKRREALVALITGVVVLLALLSVFAIELSNTQAQSKQNVKAQVHDRAVLAAALMDSLFQTGQAQAPQYARLYGARTLARGALILPPDRAYVALIDLDGRLIAASPGFNTQARLALERSSMLQSIRAGARYALSNVQPYGTSGVIDYAVAFPSAYGTRVLVTGVAPSILGYLVTGDLLKIPGVAGAQNYLIDGNHAVIGTTDANLSAGQTLNLRALVKSRYVDRAAVADSNWQIVLAAPDGPLFASVSGPHKWVPWAIFAAFALVAMVALTLGRRALRATAGVHAANAALQERNAEFARSNSDLEHFAAVASHDLQEPLRKVRTFTQRVTVMEAANLSPKGHDYLQRANAAAARMQALIEDLLRFSRVATQQRPFAPVNLDQLTQEVLRDLSDQVSRSGAVVRVGELPTILGDQVQLRQLMQNLISNALKFRRPDVDHEVVIEAATYGDVIELIVRDNGIGFDAEYAERIFGVFERLHGRSDYPGTGIGLALCRKIAEHHGGAIVAEGIPGIGATFTVSLPQVLTNGALRIGRGERQEAHVAA